MSSVLSEECAQVLIVDDNVLEFDQIITVSIVSVSPDIPVVTDSGDVLITDNECKQYSRLYTVVGIGHGKIQRLQSTVFFPHL